MAAMLPEDVPKKLAKGTKEMTQNCEFGDTLVIDGNEIIIKSDPSSPPCEALATETAHFHVGEIGDYDYLDIKLLQGTLCYFKKP